MNLAKFALRRRVVTATMTVVMAVGGLIAYSNLGRLEDPEFTIKSAVVLTQYPGATAEEVEKEVTDHLEIAIQQLGQLKRIAESRSEPGLSTIEVEIKDRFTADDLAQVWDELRRKVGDAQGGLPPGAGPSIVNDDFGDVFGVFYALTGDEYSYAELYDIAKMLRQELLLVDDVAKIQMFATQRETIYVELDRDTVAALGITDMQIVNELVRRNVVVDAGRVRVGKELIAIHPTGATDSLESIGEVMVTSIEAGDNGGGRQVYLRDIAEIYRGYADPPPALMRHDGRDAIGIGISTAGDGNVVTMGAAIKARLAELEPRIPLGMDLNVVSMQADSTTAAISGFLVNLSQAVAIVVVVLLLFMGVRSGLIIGSILILNILGTFIVMLANGVALERISLGALVIALGMLVDNAIVVIDGMLVRIKAGMKSEDAAIDVVSQQSMPLLGATAVAILAFAAIGTSEDNTGEFTRSLYEVILYSLSLSWITGMTITPLLGVWLLKVPKGGTEDSGGEEGSIYRGYRNLLSQAIAHRWVSITLVVAIFASAIYAFGHVKTSFFPDSTRPQVMFHYWLPHGTHIRETEARIAEVEERVLAHDHVTHATSIVGRGALRFLLTYDAEKANSAYGLIIADLDTDDPAEISKVSKQLENKLSELHPDAMVYSELFTLGPGGGSDVEVRFYGPDANVLRELSLKAERIFRGVDSKALKVGWQQRVKVAIPVVAESQSSTAGIQRTDIAETILATFEGQQVGVYREFDELVPIVVRGRVPDRLDVGTLEDSTVWSPSGGRRIPLRQVLAGVRTVVTDDLIIRRDRKRMMQVGANVVDGEASLLRDSIIDDIEAIELPPGYQLEWGGEFENSANAQAGLTRLLPIFGLLMVLVIIALFNALRQPLIIFLSVPLAVIGVSFGLLLTDQPFGFMAILGFLSLTGMLIKNSVVLIDEMDIQIKGGGDPFQSILDAGASRFRAVSLAALTTALGMMPLFLDAFFVSMAVTIVFGLIVATVLILVFVPVLYATFFRIRKPQPGVSDEGDPEQSPDQA